MMRRQLSCLGAALALAWSGLWGAGCAAPVEDASPRGEALGARPGGPHAGWGHALPRDEAAGVTRTVIAGDIVEYATELRVGPGEYDRIGIHRVVRERAPWRPIRARDGVMFVHGSASTFRSAAAPGLFAPDLFEGMIRFFTDPKPHPQDLFLTRCQGGEHLAGLLRQVG